MAKPRVVRRYTLGPTVSDRDKAIALREIVERLNELVDQYNLLLAAVGPLLV